MALNPKVLEEELLKQSDGAAAGMSVTYADLIAAMEKYALSAQFPPPLGVPVGAKILKSLLGAIPTTPPLPIAIPIIKVSIQLFGVAMALGAPLNGISKVVGPGSGAFPTQPPPGQPAIDSILGQPNEPEVVAKQLSNAIHQYMITGKYDSFGVSVTSGNSIVDIPGPGPWT